MRIVLTTLGSLGDVQPFVALAVELRRHGHRCVFSLPVQLLPYARRSGFEAFQLGPDLREVFDRYQRFHSQGRLTDGHVAEYYQALLAAAPQALQELRKLCADADLLISSEVMPLGRMIHEMTGIPFVYVRVSYPTDGAALDVAYGPTLKPINWLRAQLGLPPIDASATTGSAAQLALFALSREVFPPNPAWPQHYHVTGFFFLDEQDWQPDPGLATFLQSGPPPIVISLGSTVHDDPAQLTELFLSSIKAANCRALIQCGWTGLAKDMHLPDTIYAADYIPHAWLFSRAACVVHHGGAGTTAAAFRAGIPMVVIPHVIDQFTFARYAQDLGCTGAVCPYHKLDVDWLSSAIADTLADTRYRISALALSERIRAEQGVETARVLIEATTSVSEHFGRTL